MAAAVEHFRLAGIARKPLEDLAAAQRQATERARQEAAADEARVSRERERAKALGNA